MTVAGARRFQIRAIRVQCHTVSHHRVCHTNRSVSKTPIPHASCMSHKRCRIVILAKVHLAINRNRETHRYRAVFEHAHLSIFAKFFCIEHLCCITQCTLPWLAPLPCPCSSWGCWLLLGFTAQCRWVTLKALPRWVALPDRCQINIYAANAFVVEF
jgi:hypothetical protein